MATYTDIYLKCSYDLDKLCNYFESEYEKYRKELDKRAEDLGYDIKKYDMRLGAHMGSAHAYEDAFRRLVKILNVMNGADMMAKESVKQASKGHKIVPIEGDIVDLSGKGVSTVGGKIITGKLRGCKTISAKKSSVRKPIKKPVRKTKRA